MFVDGATNHDPGLCVKQCAGSLIKTFLLKVIERCQRISDEFKTFSAPPKVNSWLIAPAQSAKNTPGTAETVLETSEHRGHRSETVYTVITHRQTLERSNHRHSAFLTDINTGMSGC
jgi:hypothetical protein